MDYNQAKHEFLMDHYDQWGNTMGWLFAIADHCTFDRDDILIPSEWEFQASPFGPDDESYELETLRECLMPKDELLKFMGLLWRYRGKLKAAGLDY